MSHPPRRALILVAAFACLAVSAVCAEGKSFAPAFLAGAPAPPEQQESSDTRALLFKTINFLILAGGLAYVLRKPLQEFFSQRSNSIRAGLDEGRRALDAAQAQLSAVEDKVKRLEEEVQAFKASASREMEAEGERLRKSVGEEAAKILESTRARFETSTRAALGELKTFAAGEAVKVAEQMVRERLDEAGRKRLVSQFIAKLPAKSNN